ncbi:MAG: MMPL family transporter [Planctomycetaceae bacterium]|nr:MMPL family transporter [Planctomycetaceae bacterium]
MTNFFERKDRWGHGLALYVIAAVIFIIPPCWLALKQIHLENDVENWLPDSDEQAIALDWYLSHFPEESTLFMTWEGSSIDDPRIKLLERQLEGVPDDQGIRREGSPYVLGVSTPTEGLLRILDQGIDQEEAVRRMTGLLIGRGPLKVKLTEEGQKQKRQLLEELKTEAQEKLGLDVEILEPFVPPEPDFTEEQYELLAQIEADEEEEAGGEIEELYIEIPEHDFQVTFEGINYAPEKVAELQELIEGLHSPASQNLPEGQPLVDSAFFAAGTPVALLIRLNERGEADERDAIDAIRNVALQTGIPEDKLHMGGRLVASAALNEEVLKAAFNPDYPRSEFHKRSPIMLSMIVGVVLSLTMLRSLRLAVLVIFSAFITVYFTLTLVPITNGSMNMVLVVMPTLLMVLTMSGAIHVANYWKHAAVKTPDKAVPNAFRLAWKPCFLASVTTAIGLSSLATSSLVPVRDFGVYSAVGCLIAFIVVLYVLPSLLQFWPSRNVNVQKVNSRPWQLLGGFLCRHHLLITTVCLIVAAGSAYGLKYFNTETKVIRYFPEDNKVVQDYHYIEGNLVHIVGVDTIVKFKSSAVDDMTIIERMEVVRKLEERIRQHPEISGTVSLADFFEETENPVSKKEQSKGGFSLLDPRRQAIRRANEIEKRIKEGQYEVSSFLSLPADEDAEEPIEVSEHHYELSEPDDELWRITAQVAIMSDLDYADLTQEINEMAKEELKLYQADHVVSGMVPIFLRTQEAVLESLIRSFAYAFIVIAIVMMIVLKDFVAGLLTMLPNLWPVAVVFGLISWNGLDVDIGTMITASVALGIAVDGTLHLLTWFREGIAEGKSAEQAISLAMGHCAPALWQTSMAVGLGLFMLSFADLLLVSRFGWLMAVLIFAALFADLILLPAMLGGSLGTWIARRISPEDQDASMNLDEEAAADTSPEQTSGKDAESSGSTPEPHIHASAKTKSKFYRKDSGLSTN